MRRGWRCPEEMQLAAYVEHKLQSPTRDFVEKHVADCEFCLRQISFLVHAADQTESAEVPTSVLRRARDLVPQKSRRMTNWRWRWAAASAVAACLVLLFAFIALRFRTPQAVNAPSAPLIAHQHQPDIIPQTTLGNPRPVATHSAENPKATEPVAPTIRRGAQDLLPAVVFPRNDATLRRDELDFRWQPLADVVFYDIRVVTAEGDLIFESKTEDTHLRIADDIRLQPGAKYFVSVRAHLREGKTVKSHIVSFRISQ